MSPCKRAWEVEAARDGRLTGNERLSVERHLTSCPDCSHEQQRLETLTAALRALPVDGADELSLRRQRHALLTRAHDGGEREQQRRAGWLHATYTIAACACALLGWALWQASANQSGNATRLALTPSADAHYTRQMRDDREVVDLTYGRLTLRVRRNAHRGVLVRTPDGEIEDIGTVFTVIVEGGRTETISVSEGRVVARILGQPERRIGAGETHRPYATNKQATAPIDVPLVHGPARLSAVAVAKTIRAAAPPATRDPQQASGARSAEPMTGQRAKPVRGGREDDAQQLASLAAEAAAQFSLAVARVEAHDDVRALLLLNQFTDRFSADPRAEDAAFLRVVVLARLSDVNAMRAAAQAYLGKYPRGFRAPEVVRLLRENSARSLP